MIDITANWPRKDVIAWWKWSVAQWSTVTYNDGFPGNQSLLHNHGNLRKRSSQGSGVVSWAMIGSLCGYKYHNPFQQGPVHSICWANIFFLTLNRSQTPSGIFKLKRWACRREKLLTAITGTRLLWKLSVFVARWSICCEREKFTAHYPSCFAHIMHMMNQNVNKRKFWFRFSFSLFQYL